MFAGTLPSERETPASAALAHMFPGHPVGLQRSFGDIDLTFSRDAGASRVFQQGVLRARFPNVGAGNPPEVVLLNLAGGLTGGDRLNVGVRLEAGAEAILTTQAWEKIYRSPGDDATVTSNIALDTGAKMEWLPQPTIFFDGARLKRTIQIALAPDACFLAVESVIFGRLASGESFENGMLSDSWFVHRGGQLIHADSFHVDGAAGAILGRASALNGHKAMATLRYFAPAAEGSLAQMRTLLDSVGESGDVVAAASAWNGMMLVRFLAADGYRLNCALGFVLPAFRGRPLPKVWSV